MKMFDILYLITKHCNNEKFYFKIAFHSRSISNKRTINENNSSTEENRVYFANNIFNRFFFESIEKLFLLESHTSIYLAKGNVNT